MRRRRGAGVAGCALGLLVAMAAGGAEGQVTMFGQDASFDLFAAGVRTMGGQPGSVACNLVDDKHRICTELMQGGPYNATYVGGFALLTPAHRLVILSRNNSSMLQVTMNDAPVAPDMTQREVAYEFPSPDEGYVKLYWETQANVIGVVTDFMSKRIWGVTATESFPAHVQIEDLLNAEDLGAPGVDEHAMQDPMVTTFAGRSFSFDGQNGRTYCLISQQDHQLSARTYTAGPANHTAYVEGVGFMYKEHRVLVELDAVYNKTKEEDFLKSGIVVFVNDTRLVAPVRDDNFVMRLEYPCYDGTTMQLIWQAFRPILGNTVELTTGMMKVHIWLMPGHNFNNGSTAPPFLNADTTLLYHEPGKTAMQGVLGEAYDHLLAGDAILDPSNPLHYPDDGKFHGLAPRPIYRMVDYFDTNHTFNLFGADEYTPEALAYRQAAGLSPALDAAGAAVQAAHRTSHHLRIAVICLGIFVGVLLVAGGAYLVAVHGPMDRLGGIRRRLQGYKYGKVEPELPMSSTGEGLSPASIDRSPAQNLAYTIASSASSNWKYGDLRAELRGKHSKLDDDI